MLYVYESLRESSTNIVVGGSQLTKTRHLIESWFRQCRILWLLTVGQSYTGYSTEAATEPLRLVYIESRNLTKWLRASEYLSKAGRVTSTVAKLAVMEFFSKV